MAHKNSKTGKETPTVTQSPELRAATPSAVTFPSPLLLMSADELYERCSIQPKDVAASGLCWEELAAIYEHHSGRSGQLNTVGNYVLDMIRGVPAVHSIRMRVKSSSHLIRKVLRKRREPDLRDICYANYLDEVTDLIGIRALHLYKEDWKPIHAFIGSTWELVEKPIAYIRAGDLQTWQEEFADNGCELRVHPRNYRSVHYLIRSSPSKEQVVVEIQVRTLFEEAWSEIDHRINYPESVPFPTVAFFLEVFNRLAGTADEMGTFLQALVADLNARDIASLQVANERDAALTKVEELVSKLEITEGKREELQKELSTLRSSTPAPEKVPTSFTIDLKETLRRIQTLGETIRLSEVKYPSGLGMIVSKQCRKCGKEYPGYGSVLSGCPHCGTLN